jgi:hypothetical protein
VKKIIDQGGCIGGQHKATADGSLKMVVGL